MSLSNLLRIGKKAEGLGSQRISTLCIEPAQFSQHSATFLLPKVGVLDAGSFIVLKLKTANANQFLPLNAGVFSLLQNATLRGGGGGAEVIAQTEFCGMKNTMKTWWSEPVRRMQINNVRHGQFAYDFMVQKDTNGKFGKNAINKNIVGVSIAGNGNAEIVGAFRATDNTGTSVEMRIQLSQLFGFMNYLQLPTGLIENQMSITLTFTQDLAGNRTVPASGHNWAAGNDVVEADCKLYCDVLFWEQQEPNEPTVMEQLEGELNKGVQLTFTDSVAFKTSMPAVNVNQGETKSQQTNILAGLAGQVLRRILIATPQSPDFVNNAAANPLLGNWFSEGSQAGEEFQVTINNKNVYPSANGLISDNLIWNELSQTHGYDDGDVNYFKGNSGMTSWNGQTYLTTNAPQGQYKYDRDSNQDFGTDHTFMTHQQFLLDGKAHYLGVNLAKSYENVPMNGVSVGNQPIAIQITRNRTHQIKERMDVYCFCDVERYCSFKAKQIYVSGAS